MREVGSWEWEVDRELTSDNREQKDVEMREVGSWKLEVNREQTTENQEQIPMLSFHPI